VLVSVGDPVEKEAGDEETIDVSARDGQKVADVGAAKRPGIYKVSWPRGVAPVKAAVNVDPRESALAVLPDKDLDSLARKLSLRLIGRKQDVRTAVQEGRYGREMWFTLLMIGLAALAVEAVLGKWFSRRMSREALPVAPRATL
jgi:hypothetical protein